MEPGTPFAFLAAVQLFSVACCLAAAGGWFLPALRSKRSGLIALGGSVLAAAETASGVALGSFDSRVQLITRCAAGALMVLGAVGKGRVRAVLAFGGALVLADGALGPSLADHPNYLLAGRAVAGVFLAASVIPAIRRSLLGKAVAAIMIGVVITSIGASVVAGTALSRTFGRQQASQMSTIASNARSSLLNVKQQSLTLTQLFAVNFFKASDLAALISRLSSDRGFAVSVSAAGKASALDNSKILDAAALVDLSRAAIVQQALRTPQFKATDFLLVRGKETHLLAVGVAAGIPHDGTTKPPFASVYAIPIDSRRLSATVVSGANLSVLSVPDGAVLASSVTGAKLRAVLAESQRHLVRPPAETEVASIQPDGSRPAAGFVVLQSQNEPVGLLVASQSSDVVSRTQRLVLEGLFGALVGIAIVLAGLAFLLGRRLVDPIARLTEAATAVRFGNWTVRTATDGRDEVGELSRAFDEMTSSLTLATDQLRTTAQQEALLRERLQTVLDSLINPLLVIDSGGEVIEANPAATRLLGRDLRGHRGDSLLLTSGEPLLRQATGIHEVITESGGSVPVAYTSAPLPANAGRVVVLRDVTAEREVERMKTEFLSNVSHELRTPLTPIKGYAEMLSKRELDSEKVRSFARTILTSSNRMHRVVELLVDVSSLDAGRVQMRPRAVDLGSVIDAAIEQAAVFEPTRAADVRRRVARGTPQAMVDPEWLAKALDEVVGNALKFSKAKSLVVISAEPGPTRSQVRITVKDRGIGMSEQTIAEALSDFSQADGSATRRAEGLGLGLGFCRRLAEIIGMHISIESELGKGTEVHLDLPAAPSSARSRSRRARS